MSNCTLTLLFCFVLFIYFIYYFPLSPSKVKNNPDILFVLFIFITIYLFDLFLFVCLFLYFFLSFFNTDKDKNM